MANYPKDFNNSMVVILSDLYDRMKESYCNHNTEHFLSVEISVDISMQEVYFVG